MESEEVVEAAGNGDVELLGKDGGEDVEEVEVQEEAVVDGGSAQGDAEEGEGDESAEAAKSLAATLIQNAIRLVATEQLAPMPILTLPLVVPLCSV